MRSTIFILFLSTACLGCSRGPDSSPAVPAEVRSVPSTAIKRLDAPDPNWREMLFEDTEHLTNFPEVAVTSTDGNIVRVTAKNVGTTTLQYYSTGPDHVQMFQETKVAGKWTQSKWDWCGTGKEWFEIAPNESVELVISFWDEEKQERLLANFSEKDSNRSGLVVLASEPEN